MAMHTKLSCREAWQGHQEYSIVKLSSTVHVTRNSFNFFKTKIMTNSPFSRPHQPTGLLRGSSVHLPQVTIVIIIIIIFLSPQHRQAAAEVSPGDQAAAQAHDGLHPPAPGHHHHVWHEPQGLPREVSCQLACASGKQRNLQLTNQHFTRH